MKKTAIIILLQAVLGLFILPVQAEDELNFSIPLLSEAPEIDGELDNDLWEREALRIDNFLQFVRKNCGLHWNGQEKSLYCFPLL